MGNIRQNIETGFEGLTDKIYRHPLKTLLFIGAMVFFLVFQIRNITMDTSLEGFLHEDDTALIDYNAFRDQFGRDEMILVAIESTEIFSLPFLEKLKKLHEEIEDQVPYIDDINSLINARKTKGNEDELLVEDFLEKMPENSAEMMVLKEDAMKNPIYTNLLLSEDASFTTILIKTHSHSGTSPDADVLEGFEEDLSSDEDENLTRSYLTDEENQAVVSAIKSIIKKYDENDFRIHLVGSPVVMNDLKKAMMRDMRKFFLLATLIVASILFLMFRRISGVIFPLFIVITALLSTIGLMALFKAPIKVPTQILPSFLLAVGVGTSVHILAIFFLKFNEMKDKKAAIIYAMGHSGLAIVMTNMTTAAGLASFSTADLAPIADLGIFSAMGVILTFIYTVFLLPALIAVIPLSKKSSTEMAGKKDFMGSLIDKIVFISTHYPKTILSITAVIVLISAISASRIQFSHHPLEWFGPKAPIRTATEKIDKHMKGSLSIEVILDTKEENGWYDPTLLKKLNDAGKHFEAEKFDGIFIGKGFSVTTVLKEIHQALNENKKDYYTIPENRTLIAQEFLLFENSGSDDLEDLVDSGFTKARLTLKSPFKDAVLFKPVIERVDAYLKKHFPDTDYTITGMITILARTITNTITSMAKSYVTALLVITLLMILLIGKIRIGLLSMIPNLTPIIIILGGVGLFSLPMDLFTMLIASIAIGLCVDDTIHFMHNFRRYYEETGDPYKAVSMTLHSTGRAMLVTTVVLSTGFLIFTLSSMLNITRFGALTAVTILMALLADYFVAPALMVLVNKKKAA